jgi:hypothetical protein
LGKSNGKLIIGTLGISGSSSKMLNGAAGVIFDSIGSIYVADSNNHRIKLFLVGQSNGITIAGVTNIPNNLLEIKFYVGAITL